MEKILIPALRWELEETETEFVASVARQLHLSVGEIGGVTILRQAVDARKGRPPCFQVRCAVDMSPQAARRVLGEERFHASRFAGPEQRTLLQGSRPLSGRVLVVGMGPAGLFAAWQLAREGYQPLLIDRGKGMDQRVADVEAYWRCGRADPESNPLFGEGGAGTFSDGKLTARSKDSRCALVLDTFLSCGAPKEIGYLSKPHVGTDRLRQVVKTMRAQIAAMGGEVRFETKLADVIMKNGQLSQAVLISGGRQEKLACSALVLAIGQGARDTYELLYRRGMGMAAKAFAAGVRTEHPQAMINESQYGPWAGHPRLGAADYALRAQAGGRGVYSFCMCPGGFVVGAGAGLGQMVVNGMSNFDRAGENANAALVVQVSEEDFGSHPLDGLRFQQRWEQAAWEQGGGEGRAPASRMDDFLAGRPSRPFSAVTPTFQPGVAQADLSRCLPPFVVEALRCAMGQFARQIRGFDRGDSVLTGVETRTSAPLRLLRNEAMQSVTHPGIYPVGEGAGYAGGIVSSAVDGLKAAESIISQFAPPAGADSL